MNWETLLCAGDSITIGSRSYLGYPEYCGNVLSVETKKKWNVLNHAVAGYTVIDLARSIDKNFDGLKSARPDIATVLIGTNDLKSNTGPEIFRIAYELLVVKIRLLTGTNNLILIEIPELMNDVMLPYTISMNNLVRHYNSIIRKIAAENNLYTLSLQCEASFFYDGVHLNETGSEAVGRQVAEFILKLRRL